MMARLCVVFLLALAACSLAQYPGYQNEYFGTICEGKKALLRCPASKKILIKYADYGRRQMFKCGMGFNTKCTSQPESQKIVSNLCNGKNSCTLHASDDVFGDPCSWTKKYIALYWQCH